MDIMTRMGGFGGLCMRCLLASDEEPPPLEPCLSDGTEASVAAPVVVEVAIVTYTAQEATAAAAEINSALSAPAGSTPQPTVQVAATVSFAIDVTTIAEGTPERAAFETNFQEAMAASIGGGGAVPAESIIVTAISGGRRRLLEARRMQSASVDVDFYVEVPESVSTQGASLIAAVDTSAIQVNGATASAMTAPLVTQAAPPPAPPPPPPPPATPAPAPASTSSASATAVAGATATVAVAIAHYF